MDNIDTALRKALTEAEAKPLGAGILRPEKQAILARARQLAGCQEEEIECEIYKKNKKNIPSLVVNPLFDAYLSEVGSIPWDLLRLPPLPLAVAAPPEILAAPAPAQAAAAAQAAALVEIPDPFAATPL